MTGRAVVDASTGAKWYLPSETEPHYQAAAELLREFGARSVSLLVPELFWLELTNTFWKGVRRKRWSLEEAQEALETVRALDLLTIPSREFLPEAFTIATTHLCTVYDATYIAVAAGTGATLITADERLARAVAAYYPVRWLGAL